MTVFLMMVYAVLRSEKEISLILNPNVSNFARLHLIITEANTNAAESFNKLVNHFAQNKSLAISDDFQVRICTTSKI